MNKKPIIFFTLALIIFFLILTLSKPSPESFNEWLSNKHDIECVGDKCINGNDNLTVADRTIDDYFFINKIGVKLYYEDGSVLLIEGLGILGTFSTFTFNIRI
ncbi:hypothetical protein ACFSFW_14815 [Fredinandcohnia salidurans]|uniref:Uncharacterized protein n=1 Tax=Fredinandcohnia salidurans TaxID=2595041 RepID=A0ABW4MS49_9BACI|nr:hypothetical protein [Fredinandcohnia onubensis]